VTLQMVTLPAVPILRTGHFDLQSGPVDFSAEHLAAAVEALNDPAVLPLRVRLELPDQAHLDQEGIATEAAGGDGGPAVGWGDNYAVAGNTLYADLHLPALVADAMAWAFPARSIEGLFSYTTATGHTHDFMATGLLLLGTSWPGVTTLPDFAEVQAEFAADVAAGDIDVPSYATATGAPARVLERARPVARVAATGRAPLARRQELATAGLNVADLRPRWYAAEAADELTGLPDSYDYWSWYVTETRARDDGSLAVYVLDEATGAEWEFSVLSVADGQVTFADPVEVVRPDPVPLAAVAARPRLALARFASRAESRAGTPTASAPSPQPTEDDRPMNDAQRRALASRLGLDPETATEADIHMAAETPPPADPPPEGDPPEGEPDPEPEPAGVTGRTMLVSRERMATLEADAAAGAAARAEQIAAQRTAEVTAAVSDGRITPAEAGLTPAADGSWPEGWRRDYDTWPDATAAALGRLEAGKYPGATARVGVVPTGERVGSLARAMAASGLKGD
jgi:hypothetical protein